MGGRLGHESLSVLFALRHLAQCSNTLSALDPGSATVRHVLSHVGDGARLRLSRPIPPLRYDKTGAYTPVLVSVGGTGLEPVTFRTSSERSSQLS